MRERGKKRIRFKGRGVCGEGTRDEEEEGEASSPLWMTFWRQGLMVSTRKIEIFQVIQGWPHFSLLFPLALSLSIIKRLSVGIKQSPWGSSCVRLSTVLGAQSAFSKTRATRIPPPAKERCIFKRPVTCCWLVLLSGYAETNKLNMNKLRMYCSRKLLGKQPPPH